MTARLADPADVIADAGHQLLVGLAALVERYPDLRIGPDDVLGLMEEVRALQTRARGRYRGAAAKAATKPAVQATPGAVERAAAGQWAVLRHYQGQSRPCARRLDAARPPAVQTQVASAARSRIVASAPVARAGAPAILPAPTPPNRGDLMPQPPRRHWLVIAGIAIAVLAGIAIVIAVMARDDDPGDQAAPGATSRQAPVYTPPAEKGDYADPAELIKDLNAHGFACKTQDDGAATVTTDTCWLPNGSDQVRIDIYFSIEQQAKEVAALKRNDWQVVEGTLWSASAQSPEIAVAVQAALSK